MNHGRLVVICEGGPGFTEAANPDLLFHAQWLGSVLGWQSTALVLGPSAKDRAQGLAQFVDHVVAPDSLSLEDFSPDVCLALADHVCVEVEPTMVLMGHTPLGLDLGPRLVARRGGSYISNCLEILPTSPGSLSFIRPAYKGTLHTRVAGDATPVVVVKQIRGDRVPVVRAPGTVELLDAGGVGQVSMRVVRVLEPMVVDADITQASVIVAAGRGIGKPENLELIDDLAKALGGAMGCSRPLVDMGWLGSERQIGLSGRSVKPKLYVGCGVSGAPEHLAGMRDAEVIVAINTDPAAPIFKVARFGIVADVAEVVPALVSEIAALRDRSPKEGDT